MMITSLITSAGTKVKYSLVTYCWKAHGKEISETPKRNCPTSPTWCSTQKLVQNPKLNTADWSWAKCNGRQLLFAVVDNGKFNLQFVEIKFVWLKCDVLHKPDHLSLIPEIWWVFDSVLVFCVPSQWKVFIK